MVVEVQQAEKRATRRFALRLPVSVSDSGNSGAALAAQTRDVSARGICFYMDAPLATGADIEFTLDAQSPKPRQAAFPPFINQSTSATLIASSPANQEKLCSAPEPNAVLSFWLP